MESKKNVFTRVKEWWKELDEETRDWLKIVGIWTVDGLLWGSAITAAICGKKMNKIEQNAVVRGYIIGAMDAYKDMANQNQSYPYRIPANYIPNNTKKN